MTGLQKRSNYRLIKAEGEVEMEEKEEEEKVEVEEVEVKEVDVGPFAF